MNIDIKYSLSDSGYVALQGYVIDTMTTVFQENMPISDKRKILNQLQEISQWIIMNNDNRVVPISDVFQLENNMKYIVSIICDNTRDLDFRRRVRNQQEQLMQAFTRAKSK